MIFLSFSLAKYFNDYIDYNNEHNIPPVFFIHTKCVFFKPHNNISIKYNDIKNKMPKTSYNNIQHRMNIIIITILGLCLK
jgi:hypothetical protein